MKTNFAYSDIEERKMEKFKVFGVDSNFGYFESVFNDKNSAYDFYMHRLENADFIEIVKIKEERK